MLRKEEPTRIEVTSSDKPNIHIVSISGLDQLPLRVPLLIGDIVHALRCALDHAVTAIAGNDVVNVRFPFHKDKGQFNKCENLRAIDKAKPGIGAFIVEKLQPYEAGQRSLWTLTKLDAIDKHRLVTSVAIINSIIVAKVIDTGRRITMKNCTFTVENGGTHPFFETVGAPTIDGPITPSIDFVFPRGTLFDGKSVLLVLQELVEIVSQALGLLERFVANPGGNNIEGGN